MGETLHWRVGLAQRPGRAPAFYVTIAAATLVGAALNFTSLDPVKALIWSAIINGVEEELLAELQKLPTLPQSVTIRPYSGPKSWTWELDRIEPEVGPTQIKFVDVATVVARLQQQYDLDLSPPPPA